MQVSLRDGETQESLLARFQKRMQSSGILREFRAHRHFISKGERDRMAVRKAIRKIAQRKAKREARERNWGR